GLRVGVQVALCGDQRSVPSDLPQNVDGDACVSHPGKPGVPKVMAAKVFIAQLGDNLVPVRRIAKDRRGDPAAGRAGEEAGHRVSAHLVQPPTHQRVHFLDERDSPGALAFGSFVNETARSCRCLRTYGPGPGVDVDVTAPDAGYLTNPGRGAGGEDDDLTPAWEVISRPDDECRRQAAEGLPIGQGQ